MIRRPPRSTQSRSSAASDVYKRQLGYSLPVAAQKLKAKHGYKIPPSTLASWMVEHRELTTYSRLRRHRPNGLSPAQTIRSTKLYHRQVYSFAYHRSKLAHLREDERHLS